MAAWIPLSTIIDHQVTAHLLATTDIDNAYNKALMPLRKRRSFSTPVR